MTKRFKTNKIQNSGFTLVEILLIIALILVISLIFLINANPKRQIDKGRDAQRKSELTKIGKVLEDWYNDKGCYPKPEEICYDPKGEPGCHICGTHQNSPSFIPYLSKLPCDPESPRKDFLYFVDNINCPSEYQIYSYLSNINDPIINELRCHSGCGPGGTYGYPYSFGIASPNSTIKQNPYSSTTNSYYCSSVGNCTWFDNKKFNCVPNYPDSNCGSGQGGQLCPIAGKCSLR